VQKILRSKTSVTDIRSATIIDFSYASVLAIFAWLNNTPMSTTWAFLGLIAGREVAIATIDKVRPLPATLKIIGGDASKALFGLLVSVTLAVGLPRLAEAMHIAAGN
jgi:phosphate/sulfate permease